MPYREKHSASSFCLSIKHIIISFRAINRSSKFCKPTPLLYVTFHFLYLYKSIWCRKWMWNAQNAEVNEWLTDSGRLLRVPRQQVGHRVVRAARTAIRCAARTLHDEVGWKKHNCIPFIFYVHHIRMRISCIEWSNEWVFNSSNQNYKGENEWHICRYLAELFEKRHMKDLEEFIDELMADPILTFNRFTEVGGVLFK